MRLPQHCKGADAHADDQADQEEEGQCCRLRGCRIAHHLAGHVEILSVNRGLADRIEPNFGHAVAGGFALAGGRRCI
jgi:hypothetical protein